MLFKLATPKISPDLAVFRNAKKKMNLKILITVHNNGENVERTQDGERELARTNRSRKFLFVIRDMKTRNVEENFLYLPGLKVSPGKTSHFIPIKVIRWGTFWIVI